MLGNRSRSARSSSIARRSLLAAACALPFAQAARATAGTLRIGQSLPLSGPVAGVVKPMAEGQQALLQAVNAQGGVHGAAIELLTLDDGFQPARVVENTSRLLDQHNAVALFGYATVAGLVQAAPLLQERRVPLIGMYSGADILRAHPHPWLFTTTASLRDEIQAMVQTLATLNTRRLALAYQDNELGRFMLPQVEAIAAQHQVKLLVKAPLASNGSNAAQAAAAVAAVEPQAVLLLAAGAAILGFVKALPAGARVPLYAPSLAGTTALVEQLGPLARGLAVTQVVPYPQRQTTPLTRKFGAAMAAAGLPPTYDRMWGYLNASVLVEVLRRAGARPTPAAVQAAIEKMSDFDLGGYRLQYGGERRHGSSFVEITMVDGSGKFIR